MCMPYSIRKRSCRQSSGKKGKYVLSYTDYKGKRHRNCHTSKKRARGQIAAIEGPKESIIRMTVREIIRELNETTYSTRSTFFRNPYEDPGDEFDYDEEDPVGLVRAEKLAHLQSELLGGEYIPKRS